MAMRAIEAIRRANLPRPPENSIRLRVVCTATVLVAMAACASLGEVSRLTATAAMALVPVGMSFSYFTRTAPPGWIKVLVAMASVAAFAWFFHGVTALSSGLITIEDPLTLLLVSILVVHSFHVPARRDLMFSLAASAGLMAIGGAQAIDLQFGFYVLAWALCSLWGLTEMWLAASFGGRVPVSGLALALGAMALVAAATFLVLPAPTVSVRANFLAASGIGGAIGIPGALAGDSASPAQLARPGTSSGPTHVGGYLGFANTLDTALRGNLGHALVMLVRAQRPSYWVGETFDRWDGRSWTDATRDSHPLREQSPFFLPVPNGDQPLGQSDLQTFYLVGSTADLVFHAETANELWFPSSNVFFSGNGTIVSPVGMGRGAIYTVDSQVTAPDPAQLRSAPADLTLLPSVERDYTQLPQHYTRVRALVRSITRHDYTTYDRVQSLITWIGAHTSYSTAIPPLPPGADTVDEFLFGNRTGYCEQISTALAVMLRTLGIPAREAVGFVPGTYNPITDLYEVRADDAHAWVQVWFPGLGWQSFDPTAVVPLANPTPGSTALHDVGAALGRVPLVPAAAALAGVAVIVVLVQWRRRRPKTWIERVTRDADRAGRRIKHARRSHQTFPEYAAVLDAHIGAGSSTWRRLAAVVDASAYGTREPPPEERRRILKLARVGTRIPRAGRSV